MQALKRVAIGLAVMALSDAEAVSVERHHHARSLVSLGSDPICSSAGCTQYNHPSLDKKSKWPRDYFVPNFGEDYEISASQKHMRDQEKIFGVWNLKNVTKNDMDYRVPNFGVDSDILASQASLRSTEATLDHQWNPIPPS